MVTQQEKRSKTELIHVVKVARAKRITADIDMKRSLKVAVSSGLPQRDIAAALGVSQSAISQLLKSARAVPEAKKGFDGASPLEISERYAAGEITRDQVIEQLARWEYPTIKPPQDPYDDLYIEEPGGWTEVELAYDRGFIDDDIIDEVQSRRWRDA